MPIDTNIDPLMSRARPIGLKAVHIALYTGVSTAALSMATNHQKNLDYVSEWKPVETFISDCEEITHRSGVIPDWKNAEAVKARLAELEAERRDPPSMPTEDDWKLFRSLSATNGFVDTAARLGITMAQLFDRVDAMNKRFDYQINKLSLGTAMRFAHVDLMEKELEDRKASNRGE
jgi:hypothetical protein